MMSKEIPEWELNVWQKVIENYEISWSDVGIYETPDIRKSLIRSIEHIRELKEQLAKYEAIGKPGHDVDEFYKDTVNTTKDTLYDFQMEESIPETCELYVVYDPTVEGYENNPKTCYGKNFYLCYSCLRKI